ncbi:lipopolysaccharide biosynthesis protein [Halobacteriales archaeon Cl-PHB]
MTRSIASAFASIFAGRLLVILSLAVSTPILVWLLGASAYGQYATVLAVFNLSMILVSSGINSGARKFLAEERDRDHWRDHVFGFYFRLALALALVAAVAFFLATQFGLVAAAFGEEMVPYFYLLVAMALIAQFTNYLRRSLMGLKLESIAEPLRVANTVTFAVSAITLAWLGWGVTGALVGKMLASGVVIVAATYYLSKNLSLSYVTKPAPDWFPRRQLFTFNYKSVVYVFLLTSLYHVDVVMLGMSEVVSSGQVGYYKAALVLAEFLWFVPRSIQSTMIQSTSNLWAEGNTERITDIASKVTRYGLLLTTLLAIGIGALATDFVPLYYPDPFIESVTPLLLLLPGAVGFAVARPIFSISHAKGDLNVVIGATAASAGINLGLNALLIPRFGIAGAAIATSIGYGSLPLFHIVGARHLGFQPFADARLGRIAATAALSAVPIVALAYFTTAFVSLLVVPPTGFVIYAGLALATGAIDEAEVAELLSALPNPVSSPVTAVLSRLGVV